MTVNIYEAKSKLSQLLVRAQNGEEVIIAKAGKPIVVLQPILDKTERTPGRLKGKAIFKEGWDDGFTEDELAEMEQNLCEP